VDGRGAAGDRVRAWTPALPGVTEVFHATFRDHAYPPHCHDTWTLLLIDSGAVRYDLHRHRWAVEPADVSVLPPFVGHDGRSARHGHAFRKRVLYVDIETIPEAAIGVAVDRPTTADPALRAGLAALHDALVAPAPDDLELESRFALVVDRVRRTLTAPRSPAPAPRPSPGAAEALRDHLDAHRFERLTLAAVARDLGWTPTHLVRSFTAAFGVPPHRYLVSRRLDEARRRLLAGQRAADVAVAVGFHDQAHLSRHFTAHLATTPGRYQRSATVDRGSAPATAATAAATTR
jgi:AraC-like DNA-binding protein